jgi:hypothetical protein
MSVIYLQTDLMTADLLTKPLAKGLFLSLRNRLLNSSENPSPTWSTLRGECQLEQPPNAPIALIARPRLPKGVSPHSANLPPL